MQPRAGCIAEVTTNPTVTCALRLRNRFHGLWQKGIARRVPQILPILSGNSSAVPGVLPDSAHLIANLTGACGIGAHFPQMAARVERVKKGLERTHDLQIALLRQMREKSDRTLSVPLKQSMNCISTALGWTG